MKNLKLKWAFGFPGAAATFGQPTSYDGKLFVGSEDGTVYALDAATGCEGWVFHASATVKTAVSVDRGNAFFGDINGFCLCGACCGWLPCVEGTSGRASGRPHHGIALVARSAPLCAGLIR